MGAGTETILGSPISTDRPCTAVLDSFRTEMVSKLVLLALAALLCGVMAEFTATDLQKLNRLGDYAVSSNHQVVYSVSVWVRILELIYTLIQCI